MFVCDMYVGLDIRKFSLKFGYNTLTCELWKITKLYFITIGFNVKIVKIIITKSFAIIILAE